MPTARRRSPTSWRPGRRSASRPRCSWPTRCRPVSNSTRKCSAVRWRRPWWPRITPASAGRRSAPSCSMRSSGSPAESASGSTSTSPGAMLISPRGSHGLGPNGPRRVPPRSPARPRRILVCGDVINDVLVKPLDGVTPDSDTRATISARPGGAAANQAAWMAHLGADVTFAGRVGARDAAYHRRELARAGVRARLAADREAETGSIVIMVEPDGERTMFTDRGANLRLRRADVPARLLDSAVALHLTGYTFCEPPLLEVALWLLGQARARGLAVTIDPGSAAFLARMGPTAFLRWTDGAAVCFPNRDEAALLTGEAEPVAMATSLTRYYSEIGRASCRERVEM